ncbi:DUF4349 domain-containing protein [candidate division WWE3 bacterium]|uniref:DUF4349 domain-containing protein n=1 Tax=candidate division WWE3 bacterium TaxID=2053526 RepID=A0A7X9E7J6_UNCKA|nr:DUF4349 domain-containing protein [candidate division WWE3 bacterium]
MFKKIFNWIKENKVITVVFVVLVFLLLKKFNNYSAYKRVSRVDNAGYNVEESTLVTETPSLVSQYKGERKLVTNSNFSLLVKKVGDAVDNVVKETESTGGFVVSTAISKDEGVDIASIEVRIPRDKLEGFSEYLKSISVRTVYENITGYDITDEYTDYTTRLESLESSKAILEDIMSKAVTADEVLNIQSRIFEIQDQIDALKGQISYMEQASTTSKVSIIMSTDELSLPYTPAKIWRPDVVFKQAIRSLFSLLIAIGTFGIWVVVFSPTLLFIMIIKKTFFKRKDKK